MAKNSSLEEFGNPFYKLLDLAMASDKYLDIVTYFLAKIVLCLKAIGSFETKYFLEVPSYFVKGLEIYWPKIDENCVG